MTDLAEKSNGRMKVFEDPQFGKVRTVTGANGEPWFAAKDIAAALGYSDATGITNLFAKVPEEWADTKPFSLRSKNGVEQRRNVLCVSEQGLHFFLERSDKPAALPFQKWIAGILKKEVIEMTNLVVKNNSSVQVFDNPQFGKVRTVTGADGEPWFVAKDVAEALGYSEESNAARLFASVPEEWKGVNPIHTPGGTQQLTCVSEPGLYFFLGRSDKPAALPFQKWIAGDVLPSIRKHGAYVTPSLIDQILADPDMMIRMLTELKEERAKSAALANKVEEQAIELNESERYWTIAKYNRMNKLGWSLDTCKKAGKEAVRYAHLHNYEIKHCETNDERFGWVNSYPLDMLNMLFKKGK